MDFSLMNETDVRELIVRPLIQKLGYEPGTPNNVRSEVPLTYAKRMLGHKKPKTDHAMSGLADYICEVISHGRWTIEVKAPHIELSQKDWNQAFSYASHPEIAAAHFLITNGKKFRVYSMVEPTTPILEWKIENYAEMWVNIQNVLGPAQIRARFVKELRHRGKALAVGLGSSAEVLGGRLDYHDYEASDPNQAKALQQFEGLRANVESGYIRRNESGLICSYLKIVGPTAQWDEINKMAGVTGYNFSTSDDFISTEKEHPTIFQGLSHFTLPAGSPIGGFPGVPRGFNSLPVAINATAFTQAVGFLIGNTMRGVFSIEYAIQIIAGIQIPPFKSWGEFYINVG